MKTLTRQQEERAREVHRNATVVDGVMAPRHVQEYFDRMKSAGVTGSVVLVPLPSEGSFRTYPFAALEYICRNYRWIDSSQGKAIFATSVEDIRRAKREGKAAIIFNSQDGRIIGEDLDFLNIFNKLGIKIMQLAHVKRNLIGDGTYVRREAGLSYFGEEVVREMNRLRMLIDVAHCAKQTTLEAIELSSAPTIFSHANARALCDNIRNKSDEEIKALAKKGGVIGLLPVAPMCETSPGVWPTTDDFLKHVRYIVELVGIDHVGISLDIDEPGHPKEVDVDPWGHVARVSWPEEVRTSPGLIREPYLEWAPPIGYPLAKGMEDISCYPNITRGLVAEGYSDEEIAKILGGNWLRVFEKVWGN
jgi:membrane dipeptidase